MKNVDKIQSYLPLGYLLLVVLGITKESIYYYQLGINYIKYTSVMDILLSPIATLTQNYLTLGLVVLIIVLHCYLPNFLVKNHQKNWVQKWFGFKKFNTDATPEDISANVLSINLRGLICYLISIYVGFGVGEGLTIANRTKSNKLEYNYKTNFGDSIAETVSIVGTNSMYYFYVSKNERNLKISPIGAVKNIELINNKMIKK